MKKMLSLLLTAAMLCSFGIMTIPVSAADVSTAFINDGEGFYFSFENRSDFELSNMKLDNIGKTDYVSSEMGRYVTGANGSKGAVGIRVDDNVNDGISSFKATPGKEYELSLDFKLFSGDILKQVPNLNFFFFIDKNTAYVDEACTTLASTTKFDGYTYFTVPGSDIDFGSGNWKTGDWGNLKVNVTLPREFNGKTLYTKPGVPATFTKMFIRVGANAHALNSNADFTDEYVAQINAGTAKRYFEYALDNVCLRPATYVPPVEGEKSPYLWEADFEDDSWKKIPEDAQASRGVNYATIAYSNDVPEDLAGTSSQSLQATYTGNTGNGGFLEFDTYVFDNNVKPFYNRVYEISYWAKHSQAVVDYYNDKPKEGYATQLIPERGSTDRMDRTISKWKGFPVNDAPTTEWKKYTFYYYEEMPVALGKNADNDWKLNFHIRYHAVPSITSADATAQGKAYTTKAGVEYQLSDFKVWLDEFTVKPLDIVHNGDMEVTANVAGNSTVWYRGANDNLATAVEQDTLSANIYHKGGFEVVSDFPDAASKKALKVTEGAGVPYQQVQVDEDRPYTIKFWAKANDAASVGKSVNVYFDRDVQGAVLDNTVTDANTLGYDGYGNDTGKTGSVPFYLYGGSNLPFYHQPGVLKLNEQNGNKETLIYDDYYDRTFSKNTQANQPASAWLYQYYNNGAWVGTNDKAAIASSDTLTSEWKEYTYTYQWDYEGNHYRMPKLSFADNANYSVTNIEIIEEEILDPDLPPVFHAENVAATGKDVLSTKDSITLTWDFVNDNKVPATESANSIIKMYEKTASGELAFIGTAKADKAGEAVMKATPDMFGKALVFEVIPVDTNGNYGTSAFAEFAGRVAVTYDSGLKMGADAKSVDYTLDVTSADAAGHIRAYIGMYNDNQEMVAVYDVSFDYADGATAPTGNVAIPDAATKVKLFMWDNNFAPLASVQEINLDPVVADPFNGDNEINIVYLGDSIYEGAGASPYTERWVSQVGSWYNTTFKKDGVTVNNHYKGVGGTTTEYSLARLTRDVIDKNPDLVYISATCNDGARDSRRNLETMVRTLRSLENPPYIVLTRTTNRNYSSSYGFVEQVADFYDLPLIDDLEAFKRATTPNTNVPIADLFISDGVHPSNAGYDVISDEIIARMESGRYYKKASMRSDKLVSNSGTLTNAEWRFAGDSSKVTATGNWTNGGTYFQSGASGDTLEFTFTGNMLCFEYGLHKDGLPIEVWVDGEKVLTCDPRYNDTITSFQMVGKENSTIFDLPNTTHTVKFVIGTNSKVTDTPKTRLFNIMTGTLAQ